jgi:tetratricopeptide (TPR) repeat protein
MILRTSFLSLFVALLLASHSYAQSTALDEAMKLFRQGDYTHALAKLQEAHRAAPRNAIIENLLGITETQLGHTDQACEHYRNAIRLDPSQAAPHRNLGFNLLNAKDYVHADPELREASRLNPGDPFAHDYRMLLALATGRDEEALDEASRAGNLPDNDPEAGAGLIEAAVRTGHLESASAQIKKMEDAGQLSPAREYPIAVLLSQHALHDQAIHCFQRIAEFDPSWANRYNLALEFLFAGKAPEASQLLTALHTERPAHADTLMFLGEAFEKQEKIPEALEAYRAAAEAEPANPDRILDYTRLLMDLDRYDEAIQFIKTGMEGAPGSFPLQLRLGAVEMIKGNYAAARDAFHTALAQDPALDAAYVGIAQTYARESNDAEALRVLESARVKMPDHYLLEYYFGLLASRLDREADATVALENAAHLDPHSPDPLFELGKLFAAHQDWPRARQSLEQVIAINPQSQPAHYQLSRVYAHLGLSDKAAQEAALTRTLVDTQREDAFRKQRERGASFQKDVLP